MERTRCACEKKDTLDVELSSCSKYKNNASGAHDKITQAICCSAKREGPCFANTADLNSSMAIRFAGIAERLFNRALIPPQRRRWMTPLRHVHNLRKLTPARLHQRSQYLFRHKAILSKLDSPKSLPDNTRPSNQRSRRLSLHTKLNLNISPRLQDNRKRTRKRASSSALSSEQQS